ncbi:hypothetical protein M501DRAFT_1000826 [Patellaria atrata CBS 101060]|uniref:Uncharacterized protein n=1 Tax=Patellaria atrata CBS 101060 TaxID=1346257 RepID=A0A9P4SH90_9PEZI|nr:hypothetical protein M501DRAFT_1000826 [Patellaria atrata CBS 101060]
MTRLMSSFPVTPNSDTSVSNPVPPRHLTQTQGNHPSISVSTSPIDFIFYKPNSWLESQDNQSQHSRERGTAAKPSPQPSMPTFNQTQIQNTNPLNLTHRTRNPQDALAINNLIHHDLELVDRTRTTTSSASAKGVEDIQQPEHLSRTQSPVTSNSTTESEKSLNSNHTVKMSSRTLAGSGRGRTGRRNAPVPSTPQKHHPSPQQTRVSKCARKSSLKALEVAKAQGTTRTPATSNPQPKITLKLRLRPKPKESDPKRVLAHTTLWAVDPARVEDLTVQIKDWLSPADSPDMVNFLLWECAQFRFEYFVHVPFYQDAEGKCKGWVGIFWKGMSGDGEFYLAPRKCLAQVKGLDREVLVKGRHAG